MGDVFCPPCPLRFSPSLVPLLLLFPPLFIGLSRLLSPSSLPRFPSRGASYLYSTHLHQFSQLLATSLSSSLHSSLTLSPFTPSHAHLFAPPSFTFIFPFFSFLPPSFVHYSKSKKGEARKPQSGSHRGNWGVCVGVCVCARVCNLNDFWLNVTISQQLLRPLHGFSSAAGPGSVCPELL